MYWDTEIMEDDLCIVQDEDGLFALAVLDDKGEVDYTIEGGLTWEQAKKYKRRYIEEMYGEEAIDW